MLHDWYIPRTDNYPKWNIPPEGIHLGIEHYTKDDILMPYWVGFHGVEPHCPRCEEQLNGQPVQCPNCCQNLGDYHSYSAIGWPRKAWSTRFPPLPDDYSFYFLAANVFAPEEMGSLDLHVGSDCRYKTYLNGSSVGNYAGPTRSARWDMERFSNVTMMKGWNLLLVKLGHELGSTDSGTFMARFSLPDKRLIMVNDFAVENFSPERELNITVSDSIPIGVSDEAPSIRRLSDGTLVVNGFASLDSGHTWSSCPKLRGRSPMYSSESIWDEAIPADPNRWNRIQDPSNLLIHQQCREIKPGVYRGMLCRSPDGWKTRETVEIIIDLPDGTNLVGETNIESGPGTIMGLNIVRLNNNDLLVPMYASLKQDIVWFDLRTFAGYLKYPQEWPRQFKYRSWLLRSHDGGLTWKYVSTIAALPELGDEGFCEPNILLLKNGTLLAVLRNGGGDSGPLWISRSEDDGQTWSYPVRTILSGNYPSLIELSSGILACMYGRPNNRVAFDLTGTGHAWTHEVVLFNGKSNDHVEAAKINPGELYCVYEDEEYDSVGNVLPTGKRQLYGVKVKTRRL